jgi:hypothetical protein
VIYPSLLRIRALGAHMVVQAVHAVEVLPRIGRARLDLETVTRRFVGNFVMQSKQAIDAAGQLGCTMKSCLG